MEKNKKYRNFDKVKKYFPNYYVYYNNGLSALIRRMVSEDRKSYSQILYCYIEKIANSKLLQSTCQSMLQAVTDIDYPDTYIKFKEGYLYENQFDLANAICDIQSCAFRFEDILYELGEKYEQFDHEKFLKCTIVELENFLKEYDKDDDTMSCYDYCELCIIKQLLISAKTELKFTTALSSISARKNDKNI